MVYEFGPRLLKLRKARGWSQKDLAERIGVSDSALGNYENDTVGPTLAVAAAMADTFSVSLDYIAEGEKACTVTAKGLSDEQLQLLTELVQEFAHSSGRGAQLSGQQKELLARIIEQFTR